MLQCIPNEGLSQIALKQGRGVSTASKIRTLRILALMGLVVEIQSKNGEVRFEMTDAGRRLAHFDAGTA
jgi:Fe2+ or Zn2+ uptake regulation protein